MGSQLPVISHRCAALGGGEIDFGQASVDADRLHAFVAEHGLQIQHVAVVAQEINSKGNDVRDVDLVFGSIVPSTRRSDNFYFRPTIYPIPRITEGVLPE